MPMKRAGLAVLMAIGATPSFAHTGFHEAQGFAAGFLHPLGGLDHTLAMLSVGLLAAALGNRASWAIPASFVSMMLVGGAIGVLGVGIPAAEVGVAASVIVFGTILAVGNRTLVGLAVTLTGLFAVFHGYAHGAEMPAGTGAALYTFGFVTATALLHGAGATIGFVLGRGQMIRLAGAVISCSGVILALV